MRLINRTAAIYTDNQIHYKAAKEICQILFYIMFLIDNKKLLW